MNSSRLHCVFCGASPWPLLSPEKLQAELNLARTDSCLRQLSEGARNDSRAGRVHTIEDDAVCGIWRREIRDVEYIEKLPSELRVEAFGDAGLFEQRKIKGPQIRPFQRVPAQVAVETRRLQRECGRVEISIRIARDGALKRAPWRQIRPLCLQIVDPVAGAIEAEGHGEREPAPDIENSAGAPSAYNFVRRPAETAAELPAFAERQFPKEICHEVMTEIEVREPLVRGGRQRVLEVAAGHAVSVNRLGRRGVVSRFRVGVSRLELQAGGITLG